MPTTAAMMAAIMRMQHRHRHGTCIAAKTDMWILHAHSWTLNFVLISYTDVS